MKVLTNEAGNVRSAPVRCYGSRQGEIERVNVFVSGMVGGEVAVEALLPDGSGWVPVSTDTPITEDGMYIVDAGANVLSLAVTGNTGSIDAWIEPDNASWRDAVRTLGVPA